MYSNVVYMSCSYAAHLRATSSSSNHLLPVGLFFLYAANAMRFIIQLYVRLGTGSFWSKQQPYRPQVCENNWIGRIAGVYREERKRTKEPSEE